MQRTDKKCGQSGIPDKAKCTKKITARTAARVAGAAVVVAAGALALKKRSRIRHKFRKTGLTAYQKARLKKMRTKGTGKYGAQAKRSFTSANMPFYTEADRPFALKSKRLFRDSEAAPNVKPNKSRGDAVQRTDKKCGKSGIPDNAKCSKKTSSALATAAKTAAVVGTIAAGGAILKSRRAKKLGMSGKSLNKTKPLSKTQRLAFTANSASKAAEKSFQKAKTAEIYRTFAIAEAVSKSREATRASLKSGMRRHRLTVEGFRRKSEPGYRRSLGSFFKSKNKRTKNVRDRVAKIMDSYKKPRY